MRKTLLRFTFLFTCLPNLIFSQEQKPSLPDTLQQYIEQVFDTIQQHSMFASQVDLEQIKNEFYERTSYASSKKELCREFGKVFADLGDFHGGFYHEGHNYGMPPKDIKVSDDLATGWKYGSAIRTKILDEKYGYLFMPPMNSKSQESRNILAKQLQDSICELYHHGIEGLILDLRLNVGGDMWAMLGGLTDALEEGTYGYF